MRSLLHFRNSGLATEFAMSLIDIALEHPEVTGICAHTLAEENASCAVLKNAVLRKVSELIDDEDGAIWRWEWQRN